MRNPPDRDPSIPLAGDHSGHPDRHLDATGAPTAGEPVDQLLDSVGVWASLLVLVRRWPVVVLGLNLTLGAGVLALKTVPLAYSASGSLLVHLPPEPSKDEEGLNPYLGPRSFVGDLLVTIMEDPTAAARVAERGGTGFYTTGLDLGDAALVQVNTTGDSSEEALATWTGVATESQATLQRLQEARDVPEHLLISVEPLSQSIETKVDSGGRIRVLLAVVALGLGATMFTAFGIESRNRTRRSGPGPRDGSPPHHGDPRSGDPQPVGGRPPEPALDTPTDPAAGWAHHWERAPSMLATGVVAPRAVV